jgi:hypothetical protein
MGMMYFLDGCCDGHRGSLGLSWFTVNGLPNAEKMRLHSKNAVTVGISESSLEKVGVTVMLLCISWKGL